MTTVTGTPPGAPSAADVADAVTALQARLTETEATAFYCRPLKRRQIVSLLKIIQHYQALTRQEQ